MSKKQNTLLRTAVFFWLVAKLISHKAWVADRFYPVVPLFDFTDGIPNIFHLSLFCFSIACLVLVFAFPKNNLLLLALLLSETASCFLDVTRWQPWEYQYLFIVFVFLVNKNDRKAFFAAFLFLMGSIYVFSGLHKMSGAFLYHTWEYAILERFLHVPREIARNPYVYYAGALLGLVEIVSGTWLLFAKNKKTAAWVLIAMHFFILIMLSPLGINYNMIVWPWNLAMILLLYFLLIRKPIEIPLKPIFKKANLIVLLFWGILPIFSFFGLWDLYLSSALYTGKEKRMDLCIGKKEMIDDLKVFASTDGKTDCRGKIKIRLHKWAFDELKVPPYPEKWYYLKFKEEWEEKYAVPADFILYHYPYRQNLKIE